MDNSFIVLQSDALLSEAIHRRLLEHGFNSLGHYHCPVEAIQQIWTTKPDFFITNANLKPYNGYDIVQQVRQMGKTECVIWVSGREDNWESALDTNLSGYLDPANGLDELVDCLKAIREGRRYISPSLRNWIGHPPRHPWLARLSEREEQALRLLAEGLENETIAARLGVSLTTISSYFTVLRQKLGLSSVRQLVVFAARQFRPRKVSP